MAGQSERVNSMIFCYQLDRATDEGGVDAGADPRGRELAVRGRADAENIPAGDEGPPPIPIRIDILPTRSGSHPAGLHLPLESIPSRKDETGFDAISRADGLR